jgi:thiamine pyrophosphokinase
MNKEATIIANGEFPSLKKNIEIIKNASYLICCDGAIQNLAKYNIQPDIIIGDLDSISDEYKLRFKDRIILDTNQENNDLSKAFNYAKTQNFTSVKIFGATGKREDHTMANLWLLPTYNKELPTELITDYGKWIVLNSTSSLNAKKGQQISIFTTNPHAPICSKGLKYQLNNLSLKEIWMGSLNQIEHDTVTLKFENSQLLIFLENF